MTLLALVVLTSSCKRDRPSSQTTTTGATIEPVIGYGEAIETLASARCDREERCGGLGGGKAFPTRGTCLIDMRRESAKNLEVQGNPHGGGTVPKCPNRIDRDGLHGCSVSIKLQECGITTDFDHLELCKPSVICLPGLPTNPPPP